MSATSIRAATMGLGFAWFSEDWIRDELASGQLKALPMREGSERYAMLYLIHPGLDTLGRGARRLAEIIREKVKVGCAEAQVEGAPVAPPVAQSTPSTP